RHGILENVIGDIVDDVKTSLGYVSSDLVEQVDGKFRVRTCFVAGTKVHTKDGLKNIEDIKAGDVVASANQYTGKVSYKKVKQTFVKQTPRIYTLTYNNGTTVETTGDHPFYIQGKGWTSAAELATGDVSLILNGLRESKDTVKSANELRDIQFLASLTIISIGIKEKETTVYNFEVEDDHTYFVTEAGIWVHNAPTEGYTAPWTPADDSCKADANGCRNTILGLPENREAHAKGFKEGLKNIAESALDSFLLVGDAVACGMSGTKTSCENTEKNIATAVDKAKAIYDDPVKFLADTVSGVVEKGRDIGGKNGKEKAAQTTTEIVAPIVAGQALKSIPIGKIPDVPGGHKVDLMGGNKGTPGYKNYDLQATNGIADDVANFGKHFGPNSVGELVVNNPQTSFLAQVTPAIRPGGTITLRGQFANSNFSTIWDAPNVPGYKTISRKTGLSPKGYTKSTGSPIIGTMNEIILEKE
ncbi:hypothetical protein CH364_18565, partial [Leptospira harrisiae]